MLYAFVLLDRPDGAALRERVRPEHKAYLALVAERIAFAGPLLQDDGVTMTGSLLAIDFDSSEAAQAWLADEPFTRAGLYASAAIHAFANLWPQRAGFPAVATGATLPAGSTVAEINVKTGDNAHVQTLR